MRQKLDCLSFTLIGSDCWAVRCQCWSRQECQSGYLRNGRTGRRFLRLQATAWWSWSDSNQPPECYGTRGCPTSSPCRTPGTDSNLTGRGRLPQQERKRPVVVPSGGKKAAVVRGTPGFPMPRDGNPSL